MNNFKNIPNIGKVNADLLIKAKIHSMEELKALGCEKAFLRMQAIDPTICLNVLCALEGAIRDIRWHNLPTGRKEELRVFFNMSKKLS